MKSFAGASTPARQAAAQRGPHDDAPTRNARSDLARPDGRPNPGAGPMWGWQEFHSRGGGMFQKHGDPGWIGAMAKRVLCADFGAMMRNTNVTVAWQPDRPSGRSPDSLEPIFRELRPMTLICPARPRGSDWAISAVRRPADRLGGKRPAHHRRHGALRCSRSGDRRPVPAAGIYAAPRCQRRGDGPNRARTIGPDEVYASVADDPAVIEAGKLWDRATPSTHRNLVAAVLAAQERAGIPPARPRPNFSGKVDGFT